MSTAVRLCDGAIVVVDVVEGVSPQVRNSFFYVLFTYPFNIYFFFHTLLVNYILGL